MKISGILLGGFGLGAGIAAFALRKNRSCRHRSGEERYNEHDATLLGFKAHQTDLGAGTGSHIRKGIGREVVQTAEN